MVRGNGGGDALQHHGLAGTRGGDDQRALPHADGGDQVDHAGREITVRGLALPLAIGWCIRSAPHGRSLDFHLQAAFRVERRQVIEIDPLAHRLGRFEIDRVDLQQGKIPFPVARGADLAFDRVTGAQAKAADLTGGDIDIIGSRQVIGFR